MKKGRFLWSAHRITERQKAGKARSIKGKQLKNSRSTASKLPEYEMRLRIVNQRGEDHNQVSIRYLSEHSEIEGSVATEPRLEDLYLWLFPQTDLEKEDR